jgi:hypothetical protein
LDIPIEAIYGELFFNIRGWTPLQHSDKSKRIKGGFVLSASKKKLFE